MNEAREGRRWAITWDGKADSEFVLEFPDGLAGDENTPFRARLLAAVNCLMNQDEEFVVGIMEWFEKDFERWKKVRGRS